MTFHRKRAPVKSMILYETQTFLWALISQFTLKLTDTPVFFYQRALRFVFNFKKNPLPGITQQDRLTVID